MRCQNLNSENKINDAVVLKFIKKGVVQRFQYTV